MSGTWTFEDRGRLIHEAAEAGDRDLLSRIFFSDHFEPSLGAPGGLGVLIFITPEEKRAERERIAKIKAERDAIKKRWAECEP